MTVLVTGACGFVGSHTVEALLETGRAVIGVDAFLENYDPMQKRENLEKLRDDDRFTFVELDLREADLQELVLEAETIIHLAALPGVRGSWEAAFEEYTSNNILVTQNLLEAARHGSTERFVFASSSSVYGNASDYPTTELSPTVPHSPYGVTKLAAEHLCSLYGSNFGVPTVSLRYFTVYGPRQRPDMAMHRLIESAMTGRPFPMFGDGSQIRDFTYVGDVVAATVQAATEPVPPGSVFNVAGGTQTSLADVVQAVGELIGQEVPIDRRPAQPGDVDRTGGSTARIREEFGWEPRVDLSEGLARQVQWHRDRRPPVEVPSDDT